ncbi:aminotransferase class I/II-fold pyridoxal phosphate-dependent enzyme [Planctobacterium marinum]|uniref:GntR family transcriptional regulator n=1 Tax=Planctobacterium marinum TaxID=1631968 RepID=A0AA48KUI8_9ALTE|nr:GntR family transcriptional regulator [Planctobacterium marinum]
MKVKISGDSAQSIFESVRELSHKGELKSGDSLPSVRELAEQLGVNRNTVSAAYQRLTQAGIAITQGRLGTRICQTPDAGEQEGKSDTALFDLADGSPSRDWLPNLNDVARLSTINQYLYGEATILEQLQDYAHSWFAGSCPADFAITLCNGAIDTLERLLSAHLVPGDKVVVEDPCYISSANAIRLAGMQVMGAAVDDQGMRPDTLQEKLQQGARAVLFTPRAHNPTGVCISEERAAALKAVLKDYPGVLVMEDDHFALMAATPHHSVIPNTSNHWAVFRSVSKGLGPDLRMAFVAADPESIKRINTRLAPGMSWVSRVLQSLVMTCLTHEQFTSFLQSSKQQCAQRRETLLNALAEHNIQTGAIKDGLNVWVPLGRDCQSITYELARKGWLVRPGHSFDIAAKSNALRVSIQHIDEQSARGFARDLAAILKL